MVRNWDMLTATVSQHYTVEDLGSSLRFIIPYRTQWLTTLLLALGILFIVSILVTVTWSGSKLIQAMGFRAIVLFPVICLGVLIALLTGAYEFVELLWQVMGKEVVEVHDDSIALRHQILGAGITRRYHVDSVSSVFVSPPTDTWLTARYSPGVSLFSRSRFGSSAFRSFKRGRVALNSGKTVFGEDDTFHFGSSLDEEEAQYIVATIHQKFPQYKNKAQGAG